MLPPGFPTVRRFVPWSTLRTARAQAGLSQDELAAAIGATRRTISLLERGLSIPSLATARALARRLGLAIEELFPEDELR